METSSTATFVHCILLFHKKYAQPNQREVESNSGYENSCTNFFMFTESPRLKENSKIT